MTKEEYIQRMDDIQSQMRSLRKESMELHARWQAQLERERKGINVTPSDGDVLQRIVIEQLTGIPFTGYHKSRKDTKEYIDRNITEALSQEHADRCLVVLSTDRGMAERTGLTRLEQILDRGNKNQDR